MLRHSDGRRLSITGVEADPFHAVVGGYWVVAVLLAGAATVFAWAAIRPHRVEPPPCGYSPATPPGIGAAGS